MFAVKEDDRSLYSEEELNTEEELLPVEEETVSDSSQTEIQPESEPSPEEEVPEEELELEETADLPEEVPEEPGEPGELDDLIDPDVPSDEAKGDVPELAAEPLTFGTATQNDSKQRPVSGERVSGARHTVPTTAAPIRTRPAETARTDRSQPQQKKNSSFGAWIPGIVILAILLSVLIVASAVKLSAPAEQSEPSETIDRLPDETPGTTPEETPDKTADTEPDETVPDETEPPETEPEPTYQVTVNVYGGETYVLESEATTLGELLQANGITLGENQVVSMDLNTRISADATVNVDLYEYLTEVVSEEIPYGSNETETDTVPRGQVEYYVYGEPGIKQTTYTVTTLNGVEISREATGSYIEKEPVDEQLARGVGGTLVGADGKTYSYSWRHTVTATYYNIPGLTYIGTEADESVIATDFNYIPLGTTVYVKNDRYDFGVRTSADTGSGVVGWMVDIWLPDGNPAYDAFRFEGLVTDMEIYYLD